MYEFNYDKEIKLAKGYRALVLLAKLVTRVRFKVNYIGTENAPKGRGYILAVNHVCGFDPITIGASDATEVYFMAKSDFFENPFLRFLLVWMNSFPIKRGAADRTSLNYAIRLIKEGNVLVIFPEGTRSKGLHPPIKAKSGVALIAREAKCDVLPVSIYNNDEIKFRSKLTVRFGEIIKYEDLGFTEEEKSSELKNASRIIMDKITQLWEEGH